MARAVVNGLRDATTVLDAGLEGQGDETQLEYPHRQGRTFYTFNVKHFCHLHTEILQRGGSPAGIVVVPRQRLTIGEQVRGLAKITAELSAEQITDRLLFLKP